MTLVYHKHVMAKNLFDKKDIERELGLNYRQLRHRLSFLDGIIDDYVQKGKHGKKLFDQNAFAILKRLVELENDNYTVEGAANVLSEELDSNGGKNQDTGNGSNSQSIDNVDTAFNGLAKKNAVLEVENKQLRERVKELNDRVEFQKQQIQQLLPAPEKDTLKEKSLWQVIREWLKAPAS
ncbi:hypothetical protein KGY77_10435 [Candidatus Bipolaricaulota bacterium]|nr:hypothetical protein [Candidatus Bipolaricaulota bacterium]